MVAYWRGLPTCYAWEMLRARCHCLPIRFSKALWLCLFWRGLMGRGSGRAGRERDQNGCRKARRPTTGGRVVGSRRQRAQCRSGRTSPSTKSMSLGYIAHRQHVRVEAELKRIRMFGEASGQAFSASRTATWDRTTSGAPGQFTQKLLLSIAHQNEEAPARGRRALIRVASKTADPQLEAWSLATCPRRYAALFERPSARRCGPDRPPWFQRQARGRLTKTRHLRQ